MIERGFTTPDPDAITQYECYCRLESSHTRCPIHRLPAVHGPGADRREAMIVAANKAYDAMVEYAIRMYDDMRSQYPLTDKEWQKVCIAKRRRNMFHARALHWHQMKAIDNAL